MLAALYLAMNPHDAKSLFKRVVAYFNKHQTPLAVELLEQWRQVDQERSLLDYYTKDQKDLRNV